MAEPIPRRPRLMFSLNLPEATSTKRWKLLIRVDTSSRAIDKFSVAPRQPPLGLAMPALLDDRHDKVDGTSFYVYNKARMDAFSSFRALLFEENNIRRPSNGAGSAALAQVGVPCSLRQNQEPHALYGQE
jgi:hypothetical protein